jgi:hypothetical protein
VRPATSVSKLNYSSRLTILLRQIHKKILAAPATKMPQ